MVSSVRLPVDLPAATNLALPTNSLDYRFDFEIADPRILFLFSSHSVMESHSPRLNLRQFCSLEHSTGVSISGTNNIEIQ